jgi:hypothetical protein
MKRSISYYLIQGVNDTIWGFKHIPLSQRLLILVYGIISFFGKLMFFIRPFFTLAETNLVTLMNKRKPFSVWQMFDQVTNREQYYRLMASYFVIDLFTLFAMFILFLVPILVWFFLIPLLYGYEIMIGLYNVLIMYFTVLGIVGLLSSFSYYRPLAFITIHHPEYGSGSIISSTLQLLKRKMFASFFSLNFAYYLFLYFLGLLVTIQSSTVFFGSLVTNFGFQGYLPSLIFSIVFMIILFLLILWFFPLSYVFLMSTQHHLLMDSLKPSEALTNQPFPESNKPNNPLPISSETEIKPALDIKLEEKNTIGPVLDKKSDQETKKNVSSKTKRKSA